MKILCDTHSHTVASTHAYSTVHDYITSAKKNGLQLFSITDHAPSMPDAPHMWHFGNMQVIPRVVDNIAILRGIEANIMNAPYENATHRNVDLPDLLLPYLDFAIASFHEPVCPPAGIKENTKAAIQAIESGVIQIMGHLGNPNYPLYQEEIVRAAKDNNVLIEINNSSLNHSRNGSAPFCTSLIELVDKHSWKISVSSDAHISFQVGIFDQAIEIIQKVDFNVENIVNRTPATFIQFLAEHGKPVAEELQPWLESLNK